MSVSDVEKGPVVETEMDEAMRRMEEEEKKKEEKERQEFIDSICVLIAFIIIISASIGVVIFKNVFYPEFHNITFVPLQQQVDMLCGEQGKIIHFSDYQVNSVIRYTGNGYIPCGGYAPAPTDCDFKKYFAKVQRPYPT